MASFRDSGEAKESKQQGTKESQQAQKDKGQKDLRDLREAQKAQEENVEGTTYVGKLADFMEKKNIEDFNERQRRVREYDDRVKGIGFGQKLGNFARGIMSNLTPGRMLGSALGTALLGPLGGILGGYIGGTYGDDDSSNNFFGKMGSSLQKDFSGILGNPVPNAAELNTTTKIGDTFSMPAPSGLMGTTVYGNMPGVTSAPIGRVTNPTNAVDDFGNPVTFGGFNIDPTVQTQSLASPTTMDILGAQGLLNTPSVSELDLRSQVFNDEANLRDFNMPMSTPNVNTTTPVIDPMTSTLNFLGQMGALPSEQQDVFDQNMIGFNREFDI